MRAGTALELCPLCDSSRIISARHDNDWGGENSVGSVNSNDKYLEGDLDENGDVETFGDIDIRVCIACGFTWQRYTDIPKRIVQLRSDLDEARKVMKMAHKELANIPVGLGQIDGVGLVLARISEWLASHPKDGVK